MVRSFYQDHTPSRLTTTSVPFAHTSQENETEFEIVYIFGRTRLG